VGCAHLVAAVAPRVGAEAGWTAPGWLPATAIAGAVLLAAAWGPTDAAVRRVVDGRRSDRTYRDAFIRGEFSAPKNKRISAWLDGHTDPDDAVFVWGYEPAISFLSHRRSPTRFGYTLPVVGEGGTGGLVGRYRDELVTDLRRRPPPYVVVLEHDGGNPILPLTSRQYLEEFPELDRFIGSRYREVATIDDDATVLELRDR
jgi:hypothetical protein